jgi:hypothetical protein
MFRRLVRWSRFARRILAIATVLAAFGLPWNAAAQESGGGSVVVTVVDAESGKQLVARVTLRGEVTIVDISSGTAATEFAAVPEGTYALAVARAAYRPLVSQPFEVLPGKRTTLTVRLVRTTQLRVIGGVQVRQSTPADAVTLGASATARRLAETPLDALSAVPGVSLQGDDTPLGGQYVSLDGHPSGQTGLTLDGIPLNAPGSAVSISGLDSDLFASTSVAFGASAGAPAGTVGFRTLQPTRLWQGQLASSYGSFERGVLTASASGSLGNLGIAAVASGRSTPSLADGARFPDQSGLDYQHHGENASRGDLLTLRYRAGATTFATTVLSSARTTDLLCLQDSAALPCGYGPGNTVRNAYGLSSLSAMTVLGPAVVQATAYRQSSQVVGDLLARRIAGVPAPFLATADGLTRGAFVLVGLSAARHDLSLRYDEVASRSDGAGGLLGEWQHFTLERASHSIDVGDLVRLGGATTLRLGMYGSASGGLPRGLLSNAALTWRPSAAQAVSLRADAGTVATPDGRGGFLTDPSSLSYDCAAGLARGYAPGDAAATSSLSSLRLGWDGTSARGSFGVQGQLEVQRNALYDALVDAAALPDAAFPSGYFSAVAQAARAPVRCGAAADLARERVYLDTPIGGTTLRFASLRARGSLRIGAHLSVEPSLELLRATMQSGDARLADPRDVSQPGRQLIGVPELRGTVYAAYRPRDERGLQLLLGGSFVGGNNRANLPGYALVDAGISHPLAYGNLAVVVRNVFDRDAGVFVSPRGALPYSDGLGVPVGTLARPNAPRAVTIGYSVGIGRGARAGTADLRSETGLAAPSTNSLVPGLLVTRFPAAPPADLFERNPGAACSADYARLTDGVIAALRRYLAEPALRDMAAPYARSPVPPPAFERVTTAFFGSPRTYSLTFTTARLDFVQALSSCVHLYVGDAAEGAERGLAPFPAPTFSEATVAFSPTVGFYVISMPPVPGALQKFRTFALPAAPPAHPFRLQPEPICDRAARETARGALGELEAYFAPAGARPPGTTPSWTIERGAGGERPWYVLRSNLMSAVAAALNCAYVGGAPRDELTRRGVGGSALPALNYAPDLGLYVVTAAAAGGAPRP